MAYATECVRGWQVSVETEFQLGEDLKSSGDYNRAVESTVATVKFQWSLWCRPLNASLLTFKLLLPTAPPPMMPLPRFTIRLVVGGLGGRVLELKHNRIESIMRIIHWVLYLLPLLVFSGSLF